MMAQPQHREFDGAARSTDHHYLTLAATGRPPTEAEKQRRYRRGHRGTKGHLDPVWVETRNGMPDFRPYVYRGKEAAQ